MTDATLEDLRNELTKVQQDRDRLAMALERIARGAESNPAHEIAEIAWKALRTE